MPLAPRETAGVTQIDAKSLAIAAAWIADEKKAEDIQVVQVTERTLADYFVVLTGQNRTHVRALVNELHVRLKEVGQRHRPVEGADLGWWVVLDFGDVVVHIFQRDAREYYDLDHFYGDCTRLNWRDEPSGDGLGDRPRVQEA